jgi:hypothetical protein
MYLGVPVGLLVVASTLWGNRPLIGTSQLVSARADDIDKCCLHCSCVPICHQNLLKSTRVMAIAQANPSRRSFTASAGNSRDCQDSPIGVVADPDRAVRSSLMKSGVDRWRTSHDMAIQHLNNVIQSWGNLHLAPTDGDQPSLWPRGINATPSRNFICSATEVSAVPGVAPNWSDPAPVQFRPCWAYKVRSITWSMTSPNGTSPRDAVAGTLSRQVTRGLEEVRLGGDPVPGQNGFHYSPITP